MNGSGVNGTEDNEKDYYWKRNLISRDIGQQLFLWDCLKYLNDHFKTSHPLIGHMSHCRPLIGWSWQGLSPGWWGLMTMMVTIHYPCHAASRPAKMELTSLVTEPDISDRAVTTHLHIEIHTTPQKVINSIKTSYFVDDTTQRGGSWWGIFMTAKQE